MSQAWKSLQAAGSGRMEIAVHAAGIVLSLMVYSVLQASALIIRVNSIPFKYQISCLMHIDEHCLETHPSHRNAL